MGNLKKINLLASISLFAAGIVPAGAMAQSASGSADSAVPADPAGQTTPMDPTGLADIVVTAERRTSSVQKTSLAIDVLTADALKSAGVTQATDITRLAAGVQIGSIGPTPQVYIRGVGDFGSTAVSNPAVAFNVDGVYVGRTQSLGGAFYDLQRIEVLKGPQGTLYGRNASGGAVNLLTNRPKIGERSMTLDMEAGNYDAIKTEGAVNLPAGQNLAFRAAFQLARRDGFTSTGFNDDKHQSVRLQALWEPSPGTSLLLAGDFTHVGGKGDSSVLYPRLTGGSPWLDITGPEAAALITAASPFPGAVVPPNGAIGRQDLNFWNVHAELNVDLGFAKLTVLPAYRNARMRYVAYPTFEYRVGTNLAPFTDVPETSKQLTGEVRLSHEEGPVKWVVGIYGYDEKQRADSLVSIGILQNEYQTLQLKTRSYAGFGQATVNLAEGFRAIVGGRYTYDKREMPNLTKIAVFPAFGCLDPTVPTCLRETLSGQRTYKKATWKVGVEYDVAPRSMFYASASQGFKSGGFSILGKPAGGPEPATFNPETLTAYEVGLKNRFFDNKLQVNIEGFYWDYKDHQEQIITIDGNGAVGQAFINAGKARQYGFNLDVVASPTSQDTIHFSVEYLNSKYTEFVFESPAAFITPGSTACSLALTGVVGPVGPVARVDCSGNQLTRAPEWSGSASYSHRFDLANGGTIEAASDLTFASARWLGPEFVAAERAPSYVTVNASLGYTTPSGAMSVTAFIRNIGDEAVYTGGIQHPFVPGLVGANIGAPRTYGARASFKF